VVPLTVFTTIGSLASSNQSMTSQSARGERADTTATRSSSNSGVCTTPASERRVRVTARSLSKLAHPGYLRRVRSGARGRSRRRPRRTRLGPAHAALRLVQRESEQGPRTCRVLRVHTSATRSVGSCRTKFSPAGSVRIRGFTPPHLIAVNSTRPTADFTNPTAEYSSRPDRWPRSTPRRG
jgi:hypothetical protein